MPGLTFDDPIPAPQQPPSPSATGSDSDPAGSTRPEQSFYAWAATSPPVESETQTGGGQRTSDDEDRQSATPAEPAPVDQDADQNDQTNDTPPASQLAQDELRFDDLIPKASDVLWWPTLGNMPLGFSIGDPDEGVPDIYHTDLLKRFNPIALPFKLSADTQNPRLSANSPFGTYPTGAPILNDTTPDPLRAGAQYAADVRNFAVTNDSVIDRNTEFLLDILTLSFYAMGEGTGPLFGVRVHLDFARRVRAYDLPGIGSDGVEQSSYFGGFVRYGFNGSVRTDVLLKNAAGKPIAIYDVKTGNAKLTPSRVKELREAVGAPNVPVIELRFQSRTAILR
jgi:hypothetical protein